MNLTKSFGPGSPLKKLFCKNCAKRKTKDFLYGGLYSQIFLSNSQKKEFSINPKTSTAYGKLTFWSLGASESLRKSPYQTILLVFKYQHQLIGLWHTLTPKHVVNAKKDYSNWMIAQSHVVLWLVSLVWFGMVWFGKFTLLNLPQKHAFPVCLHDSFALM